MWNGLDVMQFMCATFLSFVPSFDTHEAKRKI